MIRAGELRDVVEVLEDLITPGASTDLGELAVNYQPVARRRANIEALEGRELERARQVVATATHTIKLRTIVGLNPRHQLRDAYSGTVYEIGHITNPDGMRVEYLCYVTERPSVLTKVSE